MKTPLFMIFAFLATLLVLFGSDGIQPIGVQAQPAEPDQEAGRPEDRRPHTAFPGANGKIVFVSDRDGNLEIYLMNADGTGQTRLTNHPAADQFPAWSPDGTKIAFISDRDGNQEIYVMNADGTDQTNLTQNPATEVFPAWSPDGSQVAFQTNRVSGGNTADIWVMNADGSSPTPLTSSSALEEEPAFSPDGTKIAYKRSTSFADQQVYLMNADGSNQALLPPNILPTVINSPDWSPDGQKIAIAGNVPGGTHRVYLINADGSTVTPVQLTPSESSNSEPAFSPDGLKIAFSSDRDGPSEIYVMNADGTSQTRLTNNPAYDVHPNWQPAPQQRYLYLPLILHDYGPLNNGDFETGNLQGWQIGQGPFLGHGSGLPQAVVLFEGSQSALLGNPSAGNGAIPVGYGSIGQMFTVNKRYLQLRYRIVTHDIVKGTPGYFDTFEVSLNTAPNQISDSERDSKGCATTLLNPTGALTPTTGLAFCGGYAGSPGDVGVKRDLGWKTVTLDLQSFQGGNITLNFSVWSREYQPAYYNDQAYYNTWVYLDDIQFIE